jgi:ketosteroid isomerase-like protein
MTSAKELLMKYMALIKDPERATSLFTADAAIEIPYLVDVGLPGKFEGHDGILAFLRQINTLFPDVAFTNVRIFVDTPDQVVSEYEVHCSAPATKRHYHQLFFGRLVASGGQITLLREAMNIISAAQTILPNGLSDVAVQTSAPL